MTWLCDVKARLADRYGEALHQYPSYEYESDIANLLAAIEAKDAILKEAMEKCGHIDFPVYGRFFLSGGLNFDPTKKGAGE